MLACAETIATISDKASSMKYSTIASQCYFDAALYDPTTGLLWGTYTKEIAINSTVSKVEGHVVSVDLNQHQPALTEHLTFLWSYWTTTNGKTSNGSCTILMNAVGAWIDCSRRTLYFYRSPYLAKISIAKQSAVELVEKVPLTASSDPIPNGMAMDTASELLYYMNGTNIVQYDLNTKQRTGLASCSVTGSSATIPAVYYTPTKQYIILSYQTWGESQMTVYNTTQWQKGGVTTTITGLPSGFGVRLATVLDYVDRCPGNNNNHIVIIVVVVVGSVVILMATLGVLLYIRNRKRRHYHHIQH